MQTIALTLLVTCVSAGYFFITEVDFAIAMTKQIAAFLNLPFLVAWVIAIAILVVGIIMGLVLSITTVRPIKNRDGERRS